MKKIIISTVSVAAFLLVFAYFFGERLIFQPTSSALPSGVVLDEVEDLDKTLPLENDLPITELPSIVTVAEGLSVPWGVAFLLSGDILVTERTGSLVHLSADGEELRRHAIESAGGSGEGGLLGLALHPDFENNRWLYLYETFDSQGGNKNRIVRFAYDGETLTDRTTIITEIDGAVYHDGGRIAFGPDGLLYVTTGDATEPDTAQDLASLSGKILRLNDDGSPADGNPFSDEVYSLGHRNPQGLAWDDTGQLWSTEHGRSGPGNTGFDELNLILPGANYGWPDIQGDEAADGKRAPEAHSGPTETWAPASAAYWDGSIWYGGLRGQALYEGKLSGEKVTEVIAHFREDFGRIRTVEFNPLDNRLYITTSNTDGRAAPRAGDDRLISIDPRIFH